MDANNSNYFKHFLIALSWKKERNVFSYFMNSNKKKYVATGRLLERHLILYGIVD